MNTLPDVSDETIQATQEVDWEAVYWQQLPRVYNFFRYRIGDNMLAEDLTATTFLKAWKSRGQYSSDLSAFSTWLLTIARNVATDYFRRQRDIISLDSLPDLADQINVEEIAQQHDDFARLARLLAKLNARERELVALKYGAEMTNRAIAEISGLSESYVGTILHRVVSRLRSEWNA